MRSLVAEAEADAEAGQLVGWNKSEPGDVACGDGGASCPWIAFTIVCRF